MASDFSLTESAAERINILKTQESNPNLRFRITVQGGGCSGFQYQFSLDATPPAAGDSVFEKNGAQVIIDDISIGIIRGASLDYTEDLSHAGFEVKNPNASSSCGCGNSFSVPI